jgi:hypothetical protein
MLARTLAGSGALVLSLAAPAPARAVPTLQPLKPCYVTAATDQEGRESEGIAIAAAGFTPNSIVDLTIDGAPLAGGSTGLQVDQSGNLNLPATAVPAPFVEHGSRAFTLTLTETGNPANTVAATAQSTALGVYVHPKTAKPSDRVHFKGRGFTAPLPIYAHYVRKGKPRKTVRMAHTPGECGSFETHRRQIPIRKPRLGKWIVQFDQSKKYVPPAGHTIVYVRVTINLQLVAD